MSFLRPIRPLPVHKSGAAAGCVLRGSAPNNRGFRLKVLQGQARDTDGPIQGRFVILDAGDNKHSESLEALVGEVTDAKEVLQALRRLHPGCVSVANTNILVLE
jgi:hypothetical protein